MVLLGYNFVVLNRQGEPSPVISTAALMAYFYFILFISVHFFVHRVYPLGCFINRTEWVSSPRCQRPGSCSSDLRVEV
jgi:hypothetical protein